MRTNEKCSADAGWPLVGGVVAAVGGSLCCFGPLVLLMLGVSGAWIANLTMLEPYRPAFIAATVLLLGWAGWQVHRRGTCEPDCACPPPKARTRQQIIFWMATIFALIVVSASYWIPLFI